MEKNISIQFKQVGDPSVLEYVEENLPSPKAGEVLIDHKFIGLNYIDIYFRQGVYPAPSFPSKLGFEASGVVKEVGEGVSHLKAGDRVAYYSHVLGAYSKSAILDADSVVVLPEWISLEMGAVCMLKGLTAEYLLHRTYPVKKGETILVHAAAGGVGQILTQWAHSKGVRVIGTAGSDEKCQQIKQIGCDFAINYNQENFQEKVMEITDGKGVPVVYDSVGKATFTGSIDSLSPFGLMVSFGNASGVVPPVALAALKGSLFLTRPSLSSYTKDRQRYNEMARNLFTAIKNQQISIQINQKFPFEKVIEAHQAMESRKTIGASVLSVE